MGELSCGTAQRVTNAVLLAVVAFGLAPGLNAQNKACGLATPDELQAVLGTKAPELKGQSLRGGDTEFCTGTTPAAKIMLRLAKKSGLEDGKEAKGMEMAKNMGAKVDVKTVGQITCSTIIPPKSMEQRDQEG